MNKLSHCLKQSTKTDDPPHIKPTYEHLQTPFPSNQQETKGGIFFLLKVLPPQTRPLFFLCVSVSQTTLMLDQHITQNPTALLASEKTQMGEKDAQKNPTRER